MNPVLLAFYATLLTWVATAIGAASVFIFKNVNRPLLDAFVGFAAGVMLAASFVGLLGASLEIASVWVTVIGFTLGALAILAIKRLFHLDPHIKALPDAIGCADEDTEEMVQKKRSILLTLAIALHNFPEGLAVGIAIGAAAASTAVPLTLGISLMIALALHNIPEGIAVSLPLRQVNCSPRRAFFFGQLSGTVEPVGGVIGALLVSQIEWLLPYGLSFAAGAMVLVTIEELIPDTQIGKNSAYASFAGIVGIVFMIIVEAVLH